MYLLKLPSSVYYYRSSVPMSLRERGFPNEVRLSLLTKERNVATEKKSELQKLDTLMKEQIKEILLDSYMLMQARHHKHDAAARKYAHRISERLNCDIPAQLRPLLDAAIKESGYSPPKENEFDS